MEFYNRLESFSDFSGINDVKNFTRVPPDWAVVVTDVKGSTKAVKEGRFKEVNMLGASAIALVSNEIGTGNTVSIFGGDGATLLMPLVTFEKLRPRFVGLMKLAREKFQLELRVGAVKISELDKLDSPIFVGKYRVSSTAALAQMMGSGCGRAEALVKAGDPRAICLKESDESLFPDLSGLSCRLEKFVARKGQILSIIVKPRTEGESTWIRGVLVSQIKEILGGDLLAANPVSTSQLKWRWVPKTLLAEIRFHRRKPSDALRVIFHVLLANVMLKFNISAGGFVAGKYKSEVPLQSDFKKFDDCLRMVIDCSEDQAAKIARILEAAKAEGHIFYGMHRSENAVVTCVAHSASSGDHVHFVDGEGGGYTNASVQLKAQLKA